MAPKKKTFSVKPGMVSVKNISFQGLEIFVKEGSGFIGLWLEPKTSVVIAESQITEVVKNLIRKRMISISKV